jgi:hypothetical protein
MYRRLKTNRVWFYIMARFDVLTSMLLKIQIFRGVTLTCWAITRRFEGPWRLHLQGHAIEDVCVILNMMALRSFKLRVFTGNTA